jgi:hypothetical protein
MSEPTNPFLDTRQAAAYLRLRPATLERWRCVGDGPVFHKFGRRVLYSQDDLDAFADGARRVSTSDPGDLQL